MSERTWTIEMMWDCAHCGTRSPAMKGKERESLKCSNCGGEKTNEPWVMPDAPHTAPTSPESSTGAPVRVRTGRAPSARGRAVRATLSVRCAGRRGTRRPSPTPIP